MGFFKHLSEHQWKQKMKLENYNLAVLFVYKFEFLFWRCCIDKETNLLVNHEKKKKKWHLLMTKTKFSFDI